MTSVPAPSRPQADVDIERSGAPPRGTGCWRSMRAVLRLTMVGLVSAASLGMVLIGVGLLRGNRRRAESWRRFVLRGWGRLARRALGMRVRVLGAPPPAPSVVVANHLGYVDIVLLAGELGGVFVARHDMRRWPGIGIAAALSGTMFVDRSRPRDALRVGEKVVRAWELGRTVVVFPEGTSSGGAEVGPFRSAALAALATRGVPVHHAAVSYRTPAGEPPPAESVCWWRDMTFTPHLRALAGMGRFDATVAFGEQPVVDTDRKELARRLREAVRANYVRVTA